MSHPDHAAFAGGCQCGACRFEVAAGPAQLSVCHCRMCQRASGNAFAPLIEVATDRVRWTGTPATFASSNIAERGFCARCGTPLFYRQTGRTTIEFMAGSLDRPEDYDPAANHGTESRLPWLARLATLPGRETTLASGTTLASHQSETR
jgi:hypothetical protein